MLQPSFPMFVIGNPENRRIRFLQEALARLGHPPARVMSYLECIARNGDIADALPANAILRLESPGEHFAVHRALLAYGATCQGNGLASRITAHAAQQLEEDRGRITFPHQWYLGYSKLLHDLHDALQHRNDITQMTPPLQVAAMFDKGYTNQQLHEASLPVPQQSIAIRSHDQLQAHMDEHQWSRAFVKLRYSSSASGVIAYSRSRGRERIITTVEMVHEPTHLRLYNSLRLRRYTRPHDITILIDTLAQEDVVVEQWLPKARAQGGVFDLRVVAIQQHAQHAVMRVSKSPMTNLHLGNQRGNWEAFLDAFGHDTWQQVQTRALQALGCFPGAHMAGVDILLHAETREPFLLEVNAFGDLLPGITNHLGHDTYTTECQVIYESLEAQT